MRENEFHLLNRSHAGELAGERREEHDAADRGDRPPVCRGRKQQRGPNREPSRRKHDAGRAKPIEQGNQDQATGGGTDQIRR